LCLNESDQVDEQTSAEFSSLESHLESKKKGRWRKWQLKPWATLLAEIIIKAKITTVPKDDVMFMIYAVSALS
jgi:hypothetical protein